MIKLHKGNQNPVNFIWYSLDIINFHIENTKNRTVLKNLVMQIGLLKVL